MFSETDFRVSMNLMLANDLQETVGTGRYYTADVGIRPS
jgi:hypothetical protein